MNALYLTVPGLAHRLSHGDDGCSVAEALVAAFPDGRWEGDRLRLAIGPRAIERALEAVAGTADGLRLAGALCVPEGWHDGIPMGLEAHRGRRAAGLAREGELLLTPAVGDVPDGVGRFEAPAALCEAIGCVVEVARDYR